MKALPARLVLEDNTVFEGVSFGHNSSKAGEVVFNTGMVGYPESFTDPSYEGQILALTYPLVGNYGVPAKEKNAGIENFFESEKIHISGLVVADYSYTYSHWNASRSLGEWLQEEKIPAITGIDTRALTKKLREKGVMLGKIVIGEDVPFYDPNAENLVANVSRKSVQHFKGNGKKVVLIDCGAKNNILRSLLQQGLDVTVVPWDYDIFSEKIDFDGLLISNGPGDPKQCIPTIDVVKKAIEKEIPTFGICLGNQLLALAAGGDTYKLKYGHRSQNQPCIIAGTKKCFITSQNHGFAVNAKTLPKGWGEWFVNANDGSNEGIRHRSKPFFSVQFHPEATPGPVDTGFLFDEFVGMMK